MKRNIKKVKRNTGDLKLILGLLIRPDVYFILDEYTKWLEENGYVDSDVWAEEPNAVDAFLADVFQRPL